MLTFKTDAWKTEIKTETQQNINKAGKGQTLHEECIIMVRTQSAPANVN